MKTFFIDQHPLLADSKMYQSHQGHLRIDAVVTAAKVLRYYDREGNPMDILRHPDQVFNTDSLATLAGLPMTLGHPVVDGKYALVTPDNWREFAVGTLGDSVHNKNPFVKIDGCSVHDSEALKALQTGNKQISPGYEAIAVQESGKFDGIPYQFRQYGLDEYNGIITYNHAAIMRPGENGRNGNDVRFLMDGAPILFDSGYDFVDEKPIIIPVNGLKKMTKSKFVTVDVKDPATKKTALSGVYQVDAEDYVAIPHADFQKLMDLNNEQFSLLLKFEPALILQTADLQSVGADSASALVDSYKRLKAEKETLETAIANTPTTDSEETINQRVIARTALIESVKPFVTDSLSGLTDAQIKVALLKKFNPNGSYDAMEPVAVDGAFGVALQVMRDRTVGATKQANTVIDAAEKEATKVVADMETVRKNLRNRHRA